MRNKFAADLRKPKYRSRVVKDKRKVKAKRACRKAPWLTIDDFVVWSGK